MYRAVADPSEVGQLEAEDLSPLEVADSLPSEVADLSPLVAQEYLMDSVW